MKNQRFRPKIFNGTCPILSIIGSLSGFADADLIHYRWDYSGSGGAAVSGRLEAAGIDQFGYLRGIVNVKINVFAPGSDSTGFLDVTNVDGWLLSSPRIRADGSSQGLDMNFGTFYLDYPLTFLMHDHSDFGGPFEGGVNFRDSSDQYRSLEEVSTSINWSLWVGDLGTPIPDGGIGLFSIVITFGGLVVLKRRV